MKKKGLLGDIPLLKKSFEQLPSALKELKSKEVEQLSLSKKSDRVNRTLLKLIENEPEPCFLLAPVLEYIEKVEQEKILDHYRFGSFELWLNLHSGLSAEENYRIRGKIAGKYIDRSEYQALFPIGMGKTYAGSHFVTAHKSPDLDTTVASFWGWMDAFAARVGTGLHVWNVPGGPPASQIEIDWLFRDLFGSAVFTHLSQHKTALSLTGNDLVTQKGMVQKQLSDSISAIDYDRDQSIVVLIDQDGYYLGDWRNMDVEEVRQVILLISSCLRWFENNLHLNLISLFAQESLSSSQIAPLLKELFSLKVSECEPAQEFSEKQTQAAEAFLRRILHIQQGLHGTFEEFGIHLAKIGSVPFAGVDQLIEGMHKAKLFDSSGKLIENRPRIFTYLEGAVRALHEGILTIRARLEKLDIALKTKYEIFEHHSNYVTSRSDIEEIRAKMGAYQYLTVNHFDGEKLYPIGVISALEVRKNILGTVSLRDFCNRDEMTIPSYLEVISVIDHHKSILTTSTPPFAVIADAQSCNSLVARQAFIINDRYSLLGQTDEEIERAIEASSKEKSALATRLTQKLLMRRLAAENRAHFYIHPEREYIEYLHFLHGIIDDTDLLSKVSAIDVECVASLLNRMKTLALGAETEIVSLDDLPRDASFPKKAAQRLLRHEELYSLYRKVFAYREKEVERNMHLAAESKPSNIFADTKEQNGCCRVGQTKMFANNFAFFEKSGDQIRKAWLDVARRVNQEKPEIDVHMHMISTIVSADEVYRGEQGKNKHLDELWIWIPAEESAIEHLKRFLNAFQDAPGLKEHLVEVEFLGDNAQELGSIFKESFYPLKQKTSKSSLPIAVLRYKAGILNSRKAMVSPFLPTLAGE